MGSPRAKSPNPFSQLAATMVRGGQDFTKGMEQLSKGDVENGLWNSMIGSTNVMSGGMTGTLTGLEGETKMRIAAEDAEAQSTADARALAEAEVKGKRDAITKRLEAEIQLRSRMPGRAQTLLTGSANVLPTANNTLLSVGKK